MADDCIAFKKTWNPLKKRWELPWVRTGAHCTCVSCSEERMERANDRACAMNVWDADGHGFYDSFPEEDYKPT